METTEGDARGASAVHLASRTGRAVVAAAVLGTALAFMSDDMLNVAIPSLAADLGGTVTDVQWVVNSYYVTLVALVLVAGSIGDIFGHRRLFLAGMSAFTGGALVCAFAPVVGVLVVGRGVQGAGAAVMLTAGLALVTGLIHPDDRNRALAMFLGLGAAVPALGPFLSGLLVDWVSWRALFAVPLVLPLCAAVISRAFVPETPRAAGRRPDFPGAAAAFVALGSFSVALIVGPADWTNPLPLAALAVAAAAAAGFVGIELRVADPMLPLRLFRRRVFLGGNVVWLLAAMVSWAAVFFVAVSLQTTLGYRPLVAGLVLMPIYLVMMIGAPLSGRLADRIGTERPTLAGLAVYTVGLWMLSGLGRGSTLFRDVLPGILVLALGMATFTPPLVAATFGALDQSDQGVASGVNNAMGQLAGLLAIATLPAAAGLSGASLSGPDFAAGHSTALRISAGIAAVATAVAAITVRPARPPRSARLGGPRGGSD